MQEDMIMSGGAIPVLNKPIDMMEAGPNGNNLQVAAAPKHPVEILQRQQQQVPRRLTTLGTSEEIDIRRLYGCGLAMQLATERKMAHATGGGGRGVAGLPSSNLMYDIVTGNDTKIQFEDFLSLPENRPVFHRQDNPHLAMERSLGM